MTFKIKNQPTRVIFKEKFHGKNIKGTYMQDSKTLKDSLVDTWQWNDLTDNDQITIKDVYVKNDDGVYQKINPKEAKKSEGYKLAIKEMEK